MNTVTTIDKTLDRPTEEDDRSSTTTGLRTDDSPSPRDGTTVAAGGDLIMIVVVGIDPYVCSITEETVSGVVALVTLIGGTVKRRKSIWLAVVDATVVVGVDVAVVDVVAVIDVVAVVDVVTRVVDVTDVVDVTSVVEVTGAVVVIKTVDSVVSGIVHLPSRTRSAKQHCPSDVGFVPTAQHVFPVDDTILRGQHSAPKTFVPAPQHTLDVNKRSLGQHLPSIGLDLESQH
jgi:hypothetical protein